MIDMKWSDKRSPHVIYGNIEPQRNKKKRKRKYFLEHYKVWKGYKLYCELSATLIKYILNI